jgi:CRISPR-associated endoribonuclease Cas6
MRLLIKLEALKDCSYDLKYYHKAQGFVYKLLESTPFSLLHDKENYKFFCFSNIMPPKDYVKGDTRTFIVSSPDKIFIETIKRKLDCVSEVKIGEAVFRVSDLKILESRVKRNCTLVTGTPIVIRIPKEKFGLYAIEAKYNYAYWKKGHSFEAFLKQLNENIYKKYEEFFKTKVEREPLFQQFVFKKTVCNHVIIDGVERRIFGSLWEFVFDYLSNKQQNIFQFAVDTGFGELNSLGFGFMNVVRKVQNLNILCDNA